LASSADPFGSGSAKLIIGTRKTLMLEC
jgi:hypothetical protein